ncbi:MAG TPA: TonB-dependent receptor [Longimicrobiaceae bacterium]|nr:TonB-dependent receptor [Longimicrobiaceae bacterium]
MRYPILFFVLVAAGAGGEALAQGGRSAAAATQAASGSIRGVVADSAGGAPVASASVAVMSTADSSLVGGALTAADGAFRVEGLAPGSYYLRISHLSHATTTHGGVSLGPAAPHASVGTVRLAPAALALEGIRVAAEQGAVRMSADRNSYSTRDLPATAGGNVTDVLRSVPAVEVDPDGRVSLRGNQNVAVQINGRAAPVRGDQLAAFLQQLPANLVERVEVVPNPSARYDPEGMAGIVNVVLKSSSDLGLSGGLTLAAGTGGRYNGSGNLGWQRAPLTLFGSYAFLDEARETTGFSNRRNLFDGAPVRSIGQTARGASLTRSHTLNTSTELKLGPRESLAGTLLVSDRTYENSSVGGRVSRDAGGEPVSRWSDRLVNNSNDLVFDGVLSFKRTAEPRRNELGAELRYNRLDVEMHHGLTLTPTAPGGAPLQALPERARRSIDGINDDLSFQADLTRMIAGVRLETGVKAQRRRVTNRYDAERFSYEGTATWQPDPGASFAFGTEETARAAYGVLTRSTGPWEVQGGLRVERTGRSFVGTDDASLSYTDLFPSGLVAYDLDGERQVKASYSRRIQRPQTFMLNSITFYEDPLNRSRGNPRLRPEHTDAFELGFQQSGSWGSFQLSPFYRRTTGAIRVIRSIQGDTTTGVFTNLDRARSYGADATASLRGERLSGLLGLNAFGHETGGATTVGSVYGSGLGWSARASGNLRVSGRTDVQAFAQYRAPMRVQQGRVGAFATTSFSVRHRLRGDRAVLTLRLTDPFDTMKNRRTTDASAEELPYVLESERSFGARAATLGFTYTFGQAPKLRAPRPQEPQAGGEVGS